jgi:uridine kinase
MPSLATGETVRVVGIAGGTGAGKSTIVEGLVDRFGDCVIALDAYYLDRSTLPAEERARINYDEPGAIDASLLLEHLERLTRGEPVEKPRYSFETHMRVGVEMICPARLVIVEGLFTLWWEQLRSLLDVKVFVDAPPDLRLIRRIRRDLTERGRTVEQVLQQYVGTVRPMHERYVEPTRAHADLVVTNDGPVEAAVERVVVAVRSRRPDGPDVPCRVRTADRMIALESCDAVEASPTPLDNVVRFEDSDDRTGTSAS